MDIEKDSEIKKYSQQNTTYYTQNMINTKASQKENQKIKPEQKYRYLLHLVQIKPSQYLQLCKYALQLNIFYEDLGFEERKAFCQPKIPKSGTCERPHRLIEHIMQTLCSLFQAKDNDDQELFDQELNELNETLKEQERNPIIYQSLLETTLSESQKSEQVYKKMKYNITKSKYKWKNLAKKHKQRMDEISNQNGDEISNQNGDEKFEVRSSIVTKCYHSLTDILKGEPQTALSKANNERNKNVNMNIFLLN